MEWKAVLVVPLLGVLALSTCGAGQTDSYLRDPNNVQNKEHIKEHMSDYYKEDDMEDQLNLDTDEATQFHYFKLHDYDNNNKLDGLELYSAINHYAQHHGEEGEANQNSLEEEQIVALVDTVMKQDDYNDDGFVDYFEFVKAQKEVKSNADEV